MEIKNVTQVFSTYFSDIKAVGGDVSLTYRNFRHWNLSKLAIFAYSWIAGLAFSVPFILAMVGIVYWTLTYPAGEATAAMMDKGATVLTSTLIFQVLIENFGKAIALVTLFVCVLGTFSVFVSYGYFLLSRTYRSYVEDHNLPVFGNAFFDWKLIWKYTVVLGWSTLYPAAPILLGLIVITVTAVFNYVPDPTPEQLKWLGIETVPVAVIAVAVAVFYAFRTGFSNYALLAEEGKLGTGIGYVRQSLALTKWKFFRIVFLILPFAVVVGFAESFLNSADQNLAVSRMYRTAVEFKAQSSGKMDDVTFLKGYLDRTLDNQEISEVLDIVDAQKGKTDGIDREFFDRVVPYLSRSELDLESGRYRVLFGLLNFFLLDGLVSMAYLSIFVRIGGSLRNGAEPVIETPEEPEEELAEEPVIAEKPKKPAAKKTAPKKEKISEKAEPAKKAPAKKPTAKKPAAKKSAA